MWSLITSSSFKQNVALSHEQYLNSGNGIISLSDFCPSVVFIPKIKSSVNTKMMLSFIFFTGFRLLNSPLAFYPLDAIHFLLSFIFAYLPTTCLPWVVRFKHLFAYYTPYLSKVMIWLSVFGVVVGNSELVAVHSKPSPVLARKFLFGVCSF